MTQVNVQLSDEQLRSLRRFAERHNRPVAQLIEDYLAYLLAGGAPVRSQADEPSDRELAALADHGGAFDWLADEPDIYSADDGEPV
jgi:hypothetical protein